MSDLEKLVKNYIPMSEASFLLLCSLVEENHGYGIMQKTAELTDGRVSMGAGTVYTILYKMEHDGIIEVTKEIDRKKVYQITNLGLEVLQKEINRIRELSTIADTISQKIYVTIS